MQHHHTPVLMADTAVKSRYMLVHDGPHPYLILDMHIGIIYLIHVVTYDIIYKSH